MTTVKHKHTMPSKHKKEIIIFLLVGIAASFGIRQISDETGMYVTLGIFGFLAALQMWLGIRRRSNTTLIAELNDKDWKLTVWMRREIPIWRGMLSKQNNNILLTDVESAYVKDVNSNHTLILQNKFNRGLVRIPQRIAHTPEFKAFMMAFLDSEDSKVIDKKTRKVIANFMDGIKE